MKKFAIMAMMALALGFTACEDDPAKAEGKPQTNPQQPIFDASSLVITPSSEAQALINLQALNDENEPITMGSISATNFPEGYALKLVLELAKDNSFAKVGECPVKIEGNTFSVTPDDLEAAYVAGVTKDPRQGTAYARYAAYAVNDLGEVRLGGPEVYYGQRTLNIKPLDSETVLQDAYYVGGKEMYHAEGVSPYDDPNFGIYVTVPAGYTFTVATSTGVKYGADPDKAGALIEGGEPIEIAKAGSYLIKANMETLTYKVLAGSDYMWTPGDSNGWSHNSSQQLFTANHIVFFGLAHLGGSYKYSASNNWSGVNYGAGAADGMLSDDGGAGNLAANVDGLYWSVVNLVTMTYKATLVNEISVCGTNLAPSEDFLVWEGDVEFNGQPWAVMVHGEGLDLSFGYEMGDLRPWNGNLPAQTGSKHVTLDLSMLPYAIYVD